jgi:hypothetical protein
MSAGRFDRRTFLKAALAAGLLPACQDDESPARSSGRKPAGSPKPAATADGGRVVVLGFDGVDPRLVERWIGGGHLPHLAALAERGGLGALGSTSPPNSPVAWSTFASGRDPSEHGVFGFIKRDPRTYLPGTAPYTIRGPRFGSGGLRPPQASSHRVGPAWWDALDRAGVPVGLLFVPYAFPPPRLRHGRVLAGLGVPDGRFTNSSFTRFTTAPAGAGESDRVAGGRIVRLAPQGSKLETALEGPRGPDKKYLRVPLQLEIDRRAGRLAIAMGDERAVLAEGQRSDWFPIRFATAGFTLTGRVRFHLLAIRDELELYASPIQIDPGQPAVTIGRPSDWAVQAVAEHGLPTVGWVHDTSAVNAGVLPKAVFADAVLDTMRARADLLLDELAAGRTRVQVGVFTGTDRAAHIFYRELEREDGGPLRRVAAGLGPADRLIVMSDHGFHPFERMLHVNTWLEQQGLFKREQAGAEIRFLRAVDWSATQAYALGNGQLYVNQQGRESQGVVAAGKPRRALLARLRESLLALRDPATGAKPIRAVEPVADRAASGLAERAPDLQIAFAPGWRSSWETSLGGAPSGDALAPNPKAWCGDHAASARDETPGFLVADRKPKRGDPDLKDLATSLTRLAGQQPSGPGRDLWS